MNRRIQKPFCCACGVTIPDVEDLSEPEILDQLRPLSAEQADQASRLYWSSVIRIIIKSQELPNPDEKQQQHYLSGIGRYCYPAPCGPIVCWEWEEPFLIPQGRNESVTEEEQVIDKSGNSKDTRIEVHQANLWDDRNQDIFPHGFPVHTYCWSVIERIIGPVAEENLDLLLQTLHERWQEHPFEVDTCVFKRQWFGTIAGSGQLIPENLVATADPGDILEIKDIIQEAVEETARKRGKRERSKVTIPSSFDLPLDVQLLVIDCLRPLDARNVLEATGWEVPLSYWQVRASPITKYFPEIEEARSEEIDREFLYQEIEEFFNNKAHPYGLQNRLRIFRVLEGTKKAFLSRLAKEDGVEN